MKDYRFGIAALVAAAAMTGASFGQCPGDGGDCCIPGGNGTPGCDDVACCEAVCAVDVFCCSAVWDGNCAGIAAGEAACDEACAGPSCDLDACTGTDEGEVCGDDTNGGCNATPNAFGSISIGETICGTAWGDGGTRDTDWFVINVPECADLTASFNSEFPGVVFIVDGIAGCTPGVIGQTGSAELCVPGLPAVASIGTPGDYVIFAATSDFDGIPCGTNNDYTLTLDGTLGACPDCQVEMQGGDSDEAEPCGTDTNGGCNSTPVVFGSISNQETVFGTAWADGGTRDTDWYQLTTTEPSTDVTATGEAEFNGVVFIVDGIAACQPAVIGVTGTTTADCAPGVSAAATVPAGTFVVFIATGDFAGNPCGNRNEYRLFVEAGDPVKCDVAMEAGDADEAEACGDDTNGGCNSTPEAFGSIDCGGAVFGNAWADGGTRDTDWFTFTPSGDGSVDATLTSEFSGVVFLVDGIATCTPAVIGTTGDSNDCVAGAPASAAVSAGTEYVVFVADAGFDGNPCGGTNDYRVTLSACGGGGTCLGDTNGDGVVNVSDLVNVITLWGTDGQQPGIDADTDNDGIVGVGDLTDVILNWGECP